MSFGEELAASLPTSRADGAARVAVTRTSAAPRFAPSIVTGIGLVLAIAGALASPESMPLESLATRVTVSLPNWVIIAAVISLSAASLIFLAIILLRPRRPRKKGEDGYEIYHEPQKIPPILVVVLILLALTPGGVLGGAILWFGREDVSLHPSPGGTAHDGLPRAPPAAVSPSSRQEEPEKLASPITTGLLGTVALLAGFGSLGFVLWLVFGDRWLRRLPVGPDRRQAQLAAAIDDSLKELRLEPDARAAIIKIYHNFERALAGAALPRRPWQTPIEFMRTVLGKLPLPAPPIHRLTRLFELARFSQHPVGAPERDSAWQSLTEIRAAVKAQREVPNAPLS